MNIYYYYRQYEPAVWYVLLRDRIIVLSPLYWHNFSKYKWWWWWWWWVMISTVNLRFVYSISAACNTHRVYCIVFVDGLVRTAGARRVPVRRAGGGERVPHGDRRREGPGAVVEEGHLQGDCPSRRGGARVLQVVQLAGAARRLLTSLHAAVVTSSLSWRQRTHSLLLARCCCFFCGGARGGEAEHLTFLFIAIKVLYSRIRRRWNIVCKQFCAIIAKLS